MKSVGDSIACNVLRSWRMWIGKGVRGDSGFLGYRGAWGWYILGLENWGGGVSGIVALGSCVEVG